jgi:hypothetical protein
MRRIEKLSLQSSRLDGKSAECEERQCPGCKSRDGFARLHSHVNHTTRFRVIICLKCAAKHNTTEVFPDGFSPRDSKKYRVRGTFASVFSRQRNYHDAITDELLFTTEEEFEYALPLHTTRDTRRS